LNLGLSFKSIFEAGVSVSVAIQTTKTTATAGEVECPKGLLCGALQQDSVRIVQGYKRRVSTCTSCYLPDLELSSEPYTVHFPRLGDNGIAITTLYVCGCPDYDLSQLEPGQYKYLESCL
jgi:hypothetical protein